MTDHPPYEYTGRNLLTEPETYEYSTVHGPPFLDAYLDDRDEARRTLESKLTEAAAETGAWTPLLEALHWAETEAVRPSLPALSIEQPLPESDREGGPLELPDPDADTPVETLRLLGMLVGYPGRSPPRSEIATEWLDRFTKRFEVRKRLFRGYDARMSPREEEPVEFVAYPLLALVALLSYGRTENLKHLNVALKLGDLVSSRRDEVDDAGVAALAHLALDEEVGAVRSLSQSIGHEL